MGLPMIQVLLLIVVVDDFKVGIFGLVGVGGTFRSRTGGSLEHLVVAERWLRTRVCQSLG